jgi:hypothetical protein
MGADHSVSTQYSNALAPTSNNGCLTIWCKGSFASPEANDTIKMCKLPAGYRVVEFTVVASAKVGDSGEIKIGHSDGTTTDDDSISGAIVVTAAVAATIKVVADPSLSAVTNNSNYVLVTATGVGANPTACDITLVLKLTPFVV